MISTRDLSALPEIEPLRKLMQSLGMLDAILSPDWEYRYFSFDSRWGKREQMGSMRTGHGDHYFAFFSPAGCWIKGFDHEAPMAAFGRKSPEIAKGVLGDVPKEFAACLHEPAFVLEETTFCLWRRTTDNSWKRGRIDFPDDDTDPDGSAALLPCLDGDPGTYHGWAEDYYGRPLPLDVVAAIYGHTPLDKAMVKALNPEISLGELKDEIKEIGYPVQG